MESLAWDLWLEIFGFGSLAWDLWLGIFGLGSLAWDLGFGNLRLGESAKSGQGNRLAGDGGTGLGGKLVPALVTALKVTEGEPF